MVFVILCGGLGTRMAQGTLPKPLTPVLTSPSLRFALEHLAPLVSELTFIYAQHLAAYNFEETVVNLFPRVRITFACVPFATRGAVETALAGIVQLQRVNALGDDVPVVFLDNDNVYPAALAARAAPTAPFLGFDFDDSDSVAFSFMQRDADGAVTSFAEKRRISNTYCTGVYGFPSVAQFLTWGRYTLQHGPFPNNEIYMSSLFVNMLAAGQGVDSMHVPIVPLGTMAMAADFVDARARTEKLRLCFNLDNTLITLPRVPGDASTARPIAANVALARWARSKGHTVIIHTARNATADVARETFALLERLDVPFDEIIFGKPQADVYIDDRAINPYFNSMRSMGLPVLDSLESSAPALGNAMPNERGNALRAVDGGRVVKSGPSSTMRGEAFFYEAVKALPIARHFPAFHGSSTPAGEITVSVVKGVPLTTVLRAGLLAENNIESAVAALAEMHSCASAPLNFTSEGLLAGALADVRARFSNAAVYGSLDGAPAMLAALEQRLHEHAPVPAHVLHGAPTFANIILTPTNTLRFIDMRGLFAGRESLNGDATTDFAHLCASLLGFDEIVFRLPRVPHGYRAELLRALAKTLRAHGVDTRSVLDASASIFACSLSDYDDDDVRAGLWGAAMSIFNAGGGGEEWKEFVAIMD